MANDPPTEQAATNAAWFATTHWSVVLPLATGIPGRSGTTSFTNTNAIGAGPFFYRVGAGN